MNKLRLLTLLAVCCQGPSPAGAVTLEQIISREDPAFNCSSAFLSVGRDGKVIAHFGSTTGPTSSTLVGAVEKALAGKS